MKNTTLALSLALAGLTAPTFAANDYRFYGKAEVQITDTDKGIMKYVDQGTQLVSPFSRIGVKGQRILNDDLTAVYKFEWQVKGDDDKFVGTNCKSDDCSGNSSVSARHTYIGLTGNFGELLLGRTDTRFKKSEGKIDLFNETVADIAQLFDGQDRVADSINYTSPKLGLFKVAVSHVLQDDNESTTGNAATVFFGDAGLKKQPYFVSVSMVDKINNTDAVRIAAQYKLDAFKLGMMVQKTDKTDSDIGGNGWLLNGAYEIDSHWLAKVQLQQDNSHLRHKEDARLVTAGLDYRFDKQTTLYGFASRLDLDTTDDTNLTLGLKYKF